MKYKFNRRQIESIATFVATNLLLLILIVWILYRADDYFNWDIIPNDLQQFIERFLITSIGGTIIISIVISLLINISLLSINVERLVDNKKGIKDEERSEVIVGKKTKRLLLILICIISLLIFGFKLWDKHLQKGRVDFFIKTYATKNYLSKLDSIINKINYKDTLNYELFYQRQDYKSIKMSYYTPLGVSNEIVYSNLKSTFLQTSKRMENNNKETSLNVELLLSFNDYWLNVGGYTGVSAFSDDNEHVLLMSKQEMLTRIFGKEMSKVELTNNENYDVYYRINNSKTYEFAIVLKTNKPAILNFGYSIWR